MPRNALILTIVALLASCKGPRHAAPIVGWHQEDDWKGACLYPPAFEGLAFGDRKLARQDALKQMISQWRGERGDGIHFDEELVEPLETVLLGQPDLIEVVAVDNLQRCQEAMTSGESGLWLRWVRDAPDRLTEGQCKSAPMDYQLFDYLDIGVGWQIPVRVCQFDVVKIKASSQDEFQIEPKGPWITGDGDRTKSTLGKTSLPCNFEGCYAGMVIARFTGESGATQIIPVGLEATFTAPEHGKLEVQINDETWFDNVYRVVGRIEHHTSIEYQGQ